MVNEQDEYDGQEEGEYHFSDEQMSDEGGETASRSEAVKPVSKNSFIEKAGGLRRTITGGIGFIILLFLVYKMLMPASKSPSTEITQVKPMSSTVVPVQSKKAMTVTQATMAQPAQPGAVQQPQMMPQAMPGMSPNQAPVMQVQVPGQPAMPGPPSQQGVASKEVVDKLAALEQNMQVAAASEAEYSQKMATYEEKNTALQTKVDGLATQVASMEAALNQLTHLLKEGADQRQAMPQAPSGARASESKVIYTVQAIIPGRAWLKSETGETVTVAEGDTIKDFGRVAKIDPYDGIVEVNTGNKIISLTYGGGSE